MGSSFVGSKIYQWIFEQGRLEGVIEGRLNEARRLVLRQETKRFGAPDAVVVASVESITVLDWLEALGERILDPSIPRWDDLLRDPRTEAPVDKDRWIRWEDFWRTARIMWGAPALQGILWDGRREGAFEGWFDGARRFLLRQGTRRFGEPDAATRAAIEATQDIDQLETFAERILQPGVRNWDDLLPTYYVPQRPAPALIPGLWSQEGDE